MGKTQICWIRLIRNTHRFFYLEAWKYRDIEEWKHKRIERQKNRNTEGLF
jgi:hypothetical protein